MALPLTKESPPLRTDEHGVVRVGDSRVTLDLVVGAFLEGATAEEIAMRYDVLDLVDVYATIAYYLRHRDEVDEYLAQEAAAADQTRREMADVVGADTLRAKLLGRHQG